MSFGAHLINNYNEHSVLLGVVVFTQVYDLKIVPNEIQSILNENI